MQMNGNAELITIADYWKQWSDPRLIILVLNNRDLNQVTWEQRAMAGDPKYDAAQHVPDFSYARYADMLGLKGIMVNSPDQVGPAWDEALAADRPCIIEAITDPDVPPLPPHISLKEAAAFASSMLKGDSDTAGMLTNSAKQALAGLTQRGRKES
jgi:pyruvate dehydrogenase (quinone)